MQDVLVAAGAGLVRTQSQYGADSASDVLHVPIRRVGQHVGLAENEAEKPLTYKGLRERLTPTLSIPITVTECEETGALGAVIGAGVATGIFADYEAGVAAMTRVRRVLEPVAAMRAHYEHRY